MNAQGIPVFYGSLEHEIAIAEIRPPVGSFVAVAQFEIIRPLQLLDFHRLRTLFSTGSPFDPKAFEAIERDQFLAVLESMITRPVMPENEHHDYLVTQAMADYLANHPEVNLDGVVFRSAQVAPGVFPANNVTLFQKSAGVELSEERFGPTADFRLYEIDEGGARIHPEIQWLSDTEKPRTNRLFDLIYGSEPEKTALRLIRDSVEIRIVEAATYKTYPYRLQQASNG